MEDDEDRSSHSEELCSSHGHGEFAEVVPSISLAGKGEEEGVSDGSRREGGGGGGNFGGGFGDENLAGVVSGNTGCGLTDEILEEVVSVDTGGGFSDETLVGVVSVGTRGGFSDETLAGVVLAETGTEEFDNNDDYNNNSNNNHPAEEHSPPFGFAVVVQDHLQYLLISSGSQNSIDSSPSEERFPPDSTNRPFGLAIFMHGRLQNLLIGFSPPNPSSASLLSGEPTDRPLVLALTFSDSQPRGDLQVLSSADLLAELFRYLFERETTTGFPSSAPASKTAIKTMPAVHITCQTPGLGDLHCAVCLEIFEIGNIAKQMPCKHIYHPGCILPWLELHSSCPICRTEMPSDDEELSLTSHSETVDETPTRSSSNPDFGLDPIGGMSGLRDNLTTQFQPEIESDTTSSEDLGRRGFEDVGREFRDLGREFEARTPLAQTRANSESSNGSFIDASGPRILPSQYSREQDNLQQSSISMQSESSSGSQQNFSFWPFRRRSYPQEMHQPTSLGVNSTEGSQQRPFWERGWKWLPGL